RIRTLLAWAEPGGPEARPTGNQKPRGSIYPPVMVYSESTARSVRLGVWLVMALGVAGAQIYPPGTYPGGGYPPGRYPGGGGGYPPGRYPGGGVPVPGTSKGKTKDSKTDNGQAYPNFRGKLKRMDDKTISLELGDNRVLDFKRTSKTKFFKNGDE